MMTIPTRDWALKMRLADSDICRHCLQSSETPVHILQGCSQLDTTYLDIFGLQPDLDTISEMLYKSDAPEYENQLLKFIKNNQLYKVFAEDPHAQSRKRRSSSRSPTIERAQKRLRQSQGTRRPRSTNNIFQARIKRPRLKSSAVLTLSQLQD